MGPLQLTDRETDRPVPGGSSVRPCTAQVVKLMKERQNSTADMLHAQVSTQQVASEGLQLA